jgi:hypothetical protein
MAAPKNNKFWNLRMKHGRDRIIQDPKLLLENFEQYRDWIMTNPIIVKEYVGKDARPEEKEIIKPMLKPGFAIRCGLKKWESVSALKSISDDFMEVVTHIESAIAEHNITYAAANLLNANIIARVEGLTERTENTHSISELPPWMKDE